MHISNQFSVSGADAVRSTAKAAAPADTQAAASTGSIQEPVDQLELSAEALEVSQASISGSFRADKVAQMREAIADKSLTLPPSMSVARKMIEFWYEKNGADVRDLLGK